MDSKGAVKRAMRRGFIGGAFCAKEAANEETSERSLRDAMDPEQDKHIRVWQLRSILPGMVDRSLDETITTVSDALGLHAVGLTLSQAARPGDVDAPMNEALDAIGDAARIVEETRRRLADGTLDPDDRAALRSLAWDLQRQAAEFLGSLDAQEQPQLALVGSAR